MNCCTLCIGDRHLRKDIFSKPGNVKGKCDYCGSSDQFIVDASFLRDSFELLLGCYTIDPAGKTLAEWFKEDWAMFEHGNMDVAHAKELLADIYDDGEIVRQCFVPIDGEGSSVLDTWTSFKSELMHENRFFPKKALDPERLEELLDYLIYDPDDYIVDDLSRWFRARIKKDNVDYPPGKMGAPPNKLASHGRANPAGIPYLYLASNDTTAISEIRPHTGEIVNVAEFEIPDNLKIVDLRNPRRTVSPFMLADESQVATLRGDIGFLEQLGKELTQPVLPHAAAIDYIPSQYLCEFIKKCGHDGVMYRSSVGDGVNIALFNPLSATVGAVTRRTVARVIVELG